MKQQELILRCKLFSLGFTTSFILYIYKFSSIYVDLLRFIDDPDRQLLTSIIGYIMRDANIILMNDESDYVIFHKEDLEGVYEKGSIKVFMTSCRGVRSLEGFGIKLKDMEKNSTIIDYWISVDTNEWPPEIHLDNYSPKIFAEISRQFINNYEKIRHNIEK
jgi:hypothetical protein